MLQIDSTAVFQGFFHDQRPFAAGYSRVMVGYGWGVDVGWKAGWRVVWWGMRGMIGEYG